MSFDWSDYFDLARELARLGDSHTSQEAESRSAISRAYYAAFCKTRNYLRDVDGEILPTGVDVHKDIQEIFLNSGDKKRSQIGQNLSRLRRLRNKADYDDNLLNLSKETRLALHITEDILSDLREL